MKYMKPVYLNKNILKNELCFPHATFFRSLFCKELCYSLCFILLIMTLILDIEKSKLQSSRVFMKLSQQGSNISDWFNFITVNCGFKREKF